MVFNALQIDVDPATGRALAIERISPVSRSERVTRHAPKRGAVRARRRSRTATVDLHTHTPLRRRAHAGRAVRAAAEAGIRTLAITDHDTLGGRTGDLVLGRALPAPTS